MVRTRADSSARKAVAAKAPRKQFGPSCRTGSNSKATAAKRASSSCGGGGNPLRLCDIPSWQKGIGEFYPKVTREKHTNNDSKRPASSKDEFCSLSESPDCQQDCVYADDKVENNSVTERVEIENTEGCVGSNIEQTGEKTVAETMNGNLIPHLTKGEGSNDNADNRVSGVSGISADEPQPGCSS